MSLATQQSTPDINFAPVDSLFADVRTNRTERRTDDGLRPEATRYGYVPIWTITGLNSNAFNRWSLPGGFFLPFRLFDNILTNAQNKQFEAPHTPREQIIDFEELSAKYFGVVFTEIAALENDDLAKEIFKVLANPRSCPKYGSRLKNNCATCWQEYLVTEAPAVIAEKFGSSAYVAEVATESLVKLEAALSNAILKARGDINDALRDLEDKGTGKTSLAPVDYLMIWNTHQDMPTFKTSTNPNDAMANIAKAVEILVADRVEARKQGAVETAPVAAAAEPASVKPAITLEQIQEMINLSNEARDAEIRELREQLAAKEQNSPPAAVVAGDEKPATAENKNKKGESKK